MIDTSYDPQALFSENAPPELSPRAIIAPSRYVQGDGVIDHLGRYLAFLGYSNPALFITEGGEKRIGQRVKASVMGNSPSTVVEYFESECSFEEVEQHVNALQNSGVDCLIAVGGGKCLDTGKAVAHCLSIPSIICPTIASTDAPCSAVSVMYTPEGQFVRPWFFPVSPAFVVVDSGIIAKSPKRHLVAGMGDALATYYEARACQNNPTARNVIGSRPTATANAIAKHGMELLFKYGIPALEAMDTQTVTEALERVIEANTLISGIGFESGGLAGAHGISQVFPVIPRVEERFLHGEMVAFGIVAQLALENELDEARRVARFLGEVGLPNHLNQLTLDIENKPDEIDLIIEEAMSAGMLNNEAVAISKAAVHQALEKANQIGLEITDQSGDQMFRSLHG